MKRHDEESKDIIAIFEITELLRFDLTSCGKMLGEAWETFYLPAFEYADNMLSTCRGTARGSLTGDRRKGETEINVLLNTGPPAPLARSSKILIYDKERYTYEINILRQGDGQRRQQRRLILKEGLQNDFRDRSTVVVFDHVVWRCKPDRQLFFREVNGRRYKWPINVTDFNITYFPESVSVLYLIEIDKKEQVRGYKFLINAPVAGAPLES